MTVRVVPDHRRLVHVAGTRAQPSGCAAQRRRVSPTRQWRGPAAPPRRDDHRRWETDGRGWAHG
ncbi:hypothetical protein CA850_03525 [Micromonospora echinospora]|nr:hypothetical protein CA850_03525 [Micromonospora echinospora]